MAIQKYEPEEIYPVPFQNSDQMYELIRRQQEIQRQQQAIAFMQLMKQQEPSIQGTYQPERHQVEKRSPLSGLAKKLDNALLFCICLLVIVVICQATSLSLSRPYPVQNTQEIN